MSKNMITEIELSLFMISERLYSIGISMFRVSDKKRLNILNPNVVSIVLTALLVREIVSYFVGDRRLSMMIGDLSFNWMLKPMWNLSIASALVIILSHQTIHRYYGSRNDFPFWLVVQKNSQDMTVETKFPYLIKLVEMSVKLWVVLASVTTIAIYLFGSTTTEALTYGLFATFSNFWLTYYVIQMALWQVLCYCLIAYRFKLQLKVKNNRLLYLSNKIDLNIAIKVKNSLRTIDRIHTSIHTFDKFWSKIAFVFTILCAIIFGVSISQLFSNVELIMKITLSMMAITTSIIITTIFVSSSLIYVEANKTHRILFGLINQKWVAKDLDYKLKVNYFKFRMTII